ncbi:MAG: alkaline phosphatase family protein [Prolixibacteraceae bacterium]|jgi:predicted AlkP superfamily pyrophosphatase or phosphodiesterase|nr:alkaline phosphatase family protein [Prolixibacteraceae bacterium]MBT6766514.1 alkaline phosphatase family protein [Prolixibacteraceae bacterium]MBT6997896.1 alkaline phosphatase family protein [Prolixibacteraceae bacterium]MBT7395616.1 alkaline phosphatase family protein [Prolixibacteraceae bacterium]
MREGIFILSLIFVFIFSNSVSAQRNKEKQTNKPKVVIGIVVENMRPDYIQRFWDKFQPNGFKKLYSNGAVCTNVNITQHVQNYASGTATLFTGVNPSIHGIIDKTWYDRLKQKELECTDDNYYFTVGADTKAGNASPVKLLSNTITDNLKIFTLGKAKVFSAALNRESAIFAAGHSADGAYWFDVESGRMISSSFYVSTFPDWVRNFNSENYAEIYSYRNWTTLLPETTYNESLEDDYLLEKGYFDKWNTFPHNISRYIKRTKDFRPFKTTPSANLMVQKFAIEILENEEIGTDEITDFVTTVFSSMDYENGSFGPASLEMEDTYLYLDQYIGQLIDFAENKFGKENVLFFLTANTSASYPVDYLKEEFNLPVDNFNIESAIALLTSFLNITYGEEKWIEHYNDLQVYLNHELIDKNNLDLNEMRDVTSNFINQFEGVQLSMPSYQLEQGSSANGLLSPIYKSYAKNRSGDFLYLLKEGWQPTYKFKKVNYTDQSHIPLVFYGAQIEPKRINGKYNAIDLAPTLSELLEIPVPDKCQGKIIEDVIVK